MRMPKAKPQKCKNPDGYVWRSTNTRTNGSSGYLPREVFARLNPTMPNPECSPSGLWYRTEKEALNDLNRVLSEMS